MSNCNHCRTPLQITCYAKMRVGQVTPLRCTRCGAVHAHLNGSVDVISPVMLPAGSGAKRSPWMLPTTRPLAPGRYDCRFRGVDEVLVLWWNGHNFQPSADDTRAVQMRDFLTWRGDWT